MELRHLAQFLAIVDTGSLTKAAKTMQLSPQAMSLNLTKLEKSVGAKLFQRGGTGASLTKEGMALLSYARTITTEAERAARAVELSKTQQTGSLKIGVGDAITSWYVPPAVAALREKLPDVRIVLEEAHSEVLLPRLLAGEFDLVLGALPTEWQVTDELVQTYLFETRDRVVARRSHPLAPRRALGIADLAGYPWLVSDKVPEQYATICNAFVVADLPVPTDIVWSDSASTGLSLLLADNYLMLGTGGVFPELYEAGLLARVDVAEPSQTRRALLSHRNGVTLTPAAQTFIEEIVTAARRKTPPRALRA